MLKCSKPALRSSVVAVFTCWLLWLRWRYCNAKPERLEDGSTLWHGTIIDITERKQREQEILTLNQRLEILIDSIQQLSAADSLLMVQEIVAGSARKLIGSDGATIVFRENDHCYYVNEDAIMPLWKGKRFPIHACISGWVMENRSPVVIEDVFSDERIPKDVYSPTFVKSLAMVPINVKNPVGAIGNYWKDPYTATETELQLLQTLSDAAARAIENIQLYADLEERVKLRTSQLQSVNRELETFTYSVSHDLKAPLRGIDGYSKLLLDEYGESLDNEAIHFINTIRGSTKRMNQLIEDLLSYSRLERSQFKYERIALKPFIERLLGHYREELEEDHFRVELTVPEVEILADATGLSIALRNLIENSIKFTRERPDPAIEIGFKEEGGSWIIDVKDNGVGFEMKYHDRIFEIFQRLHLAEAFPGTGIGLAMVSKAFFIEIPKKKPDKLLIG